MVAVGCGGHSSAGSGRSGVSSAVAPVTTTVTGAAPESTVTTSAAVVASPSVAVSPQSPCTVGDLRLTAAVNSSAGESEFLVSAVTDRACTVTGFFGAAGYDGPTAVFTTTHRAGDASTPEALRAGGSVRLLLDAFYTTTTGSDCPRITTLHLTPPNQRDFAVVAVTGTGFACPGSVTVHPT